MRQISEQVIVITGAANGIGLATAINAAERGARIILSGPDENELRDAVCLIRQKGGDALFVAADVSKIDDVDKIAERALSEFGRIDSWINNAGVAVFGKLTEVPIEVKRQLFEINFWGVVYGCRAAVKAMKNSGGSIVNVTTVESDLFPFGMDSVTNHSVRAYTDALRMELLSEEAPITVSLANRDDDELTSKTILNWCETSSREGLIGLARKFYPGKSAAVAAGLGVAAYAAYKALQNARKPDEVTH